ncbi:MAG: hypothetical protein ABI606_07810 [Rhodoferax sp.]
MTTPPVVNPPLGDMLSVRARLMTLGWANMATWARAHGYAHQTCCYVVRTWGQRPDRAPHGGINRAIVRDLRATLTQGTGPGDPKQAA